MYRVWKARKFRRATLWRADLLVERKRSAARRVSALRYAVIPSIPLYPFLQLFDVYPLTSVSYHYHDHCYCQAIQVWLERLLRAGKARKAFQRNLLLCMMKVWDVKEGQFFWLNQFTKTPTWTKPRLLVRYGDVPDPSLWVEGTRPTTLTLHTNSLTHSQILS